MRYTRLSQDDADRIADLAAQQAAEVASKEAAEVASRQAAEAASEHVLRRLGIDADSFDSIEDARATLEWAKQAKEGTEQMRRAVRRGASYGAATTFGAGLVYGVWRLIEVATKTKGGP